jgi:hypothetical protein
VQAHHSLRVARETMVVGSSVAQVAGYALTGGIRAAE